MFQGLIINFHEVIFYFFAAVLIFSAVMTIASRHPVRGVLFLVVAFFASAVLWMTLEAEFLALVLIFVYVGAVMTLFLFVVMMLNLDTAPVKQRWVRYLPLGVVIMLAVLAMLLHVINANNFPPSQYPAMSHAANYSNVKALGQVLYTQYVYQFELAAVLLLVAIIAAISLVFRGRHRSKAQRISQQVATTAARRVSLVSMTADK